MKPSRIYKILLFCIAAVWIVNGLFCKVLNWVPRHQQIVGQILGLQYARAITVLIGVAEIGMAVWILSGYRSKLNVIMQILVVATMNTIEYFLVPNLLLWGKFNSLFALLFIVVIYINEFHLHKSK